MANDNIKTESRKERVLDAALHVFAEKGFLDATITEISKEAKVSEASIYGYFSSKEDLLFTIAEVVTKKNFKELLKFLSIIKEPEVKLRLLMRYQFQFYQTNHHYSALILLQLMTSKRFRQTPAHVQIRRWTHTLLDCIEEGIINGTFKKDTNSYLIRSMLMGTMEHLIIHWHMQGRPQKKISIMDIFDHALDMILDTIRNKKEESGLTLHLTMDDVEKLQRIIDAKSLLEKSKSRNAKKTGSII